MMAPTKMKLRMRKKDGSGKTSWRSMSVEASPDSKCPICLDRFNNMASLDRCLHKFCFRCIQEWSKNKAECPLCKLPFNSIFHTIKAENDFKEFVLRPAEIGFLGSPSRPGRERPSSAPGPQRQDRGVRRMMVRLAARRRTQKRGRASRRLREQMVVTFRRALYRSGVRVHNVGDSGGGRRDISAAFFQRNPTCLHRLVPWLKRELTVLYGAHGSLVNIVLHIVMSRVTRYDMDDQAIRDELRPFLLARTDHFLHELISFARSPYNMEVYDQHAVYDRPAPSYEEGSGGSDASVIAISEDEGGHLAETARRPSSMTGVDLSQAPWDDETPGPSYSTVEQTQSPSLSVSKLESNRGEVPGPQEQTEPSVRAEDGPDWVAKEGWDTSAAEDDCLIVGYVKPMAERTPELVQLSSDSEGSAPHEEPPGHLWFPSLSPPSSCVARRGSSPCALIQCLPCGTPKPEGEDPGPLTSRQEHGGDCGADLDVAFLPMDRGRRCGDEPICEKEEERHWDCSRSGGRDGSDCRDGGGWWLRSPTISVHSDSTPSCRRVRSRSPSRDRVRKRRRDRDVGQPRCGYGEAVTVTESYSRESRSREVLYTESRAHRSRLHGGRTHGPRSHPTMAWSRSPSSTSSQGSAPWWPRPDKPGGKRKYKTRHLESSSKSSTWVDGRRGGGGERRCKRSRKKSRSPSVEIIYEGESSGAARRQQRKRKKHRKRSRRHKSPQHGSPAVITIDSDSDRAVDNNGRASEVSDRTAEAKPIGSENEVSSPGTERPARALLLESILQELQQQQHILPIDQDCADVQVASSELQFDYDENGARHGESRRSSVPSSDEASADSPVMAIGGHFIRQGCLDKAPDASAFCWSD